MNRIRVEVEVYNQNRIDTIFIEYSDETTLREVLDNLDYPASELKLYKYITLKPYIYYHERKLPYIYNGTEIIWFQDFDNTRVIDFIKTYKTDIIYAVGFNDGIGGDGGIILLEISEMWQQLYPIFEDISVVLGIIGGGRALANWIKSLFTKKVPPIAIFELINSRDFWNHQEFAELLNINKDDSKQLLKAIGFEWNRKMRMYIKTKKTLELIDKIANVQWYKDIE